MAFARLIDNPQGSQEQYDGLLERLGMGRENPPAGGLIHFAGPSPNGGWRIVEVWESEEAARRFDEEHLLPLLREAGFERSEPQGWPVHRVMAQETFA
jgi:hypothetical protein